MWVVCRPYQLHSSVAFGFYETKRKEKNRLMGALVMFAFVSLSAIVGVIYFTYEDKKEAKKNSK